MVRAKIISLCYSQFSVLLLIMVQVDADCLAEHIENVFDWQYSVQSMGRFFSLPFDPSSVFDTVEGQVEAMKGKMDEGQEVEEVCEEKVKSEAELETFSPETEGMKQEKLLMMKDENGYNDDKVDYELASGDEF